MFNVTSIGLWGVLCLIFVLLCIAFLVLLPSLGGRESLLLYFNCYSDDM